MTRLPAGKRREQLLDCAADLFAQAGYARATTAQLARAAGVTEPIIYRHFASKRELFVALIERASEQTLHSWKVHLAAATDPAERLRTLIGDNPMVSQSGRAAYRVILQAITEVEDPGIRAAIDKHIRRVHEFLVEEIAAAQANHKVTSRLSAEILAWLLVHLGLGYGVLSALGVRDHGRDEHGVHVQDVISRLLVGRAGEGKGE